MTTGVFDGNFLSAAPQPTVPHVKRINSFRRSLVLDDSGGGGSEFFRQKSQRRSVAESTHDVLVREDPRHRVRIGYGDSLNPAHRCQPLALLCIVGVLLQARLVEFCVEYRTGLPDLKVLYRHSFGHDLTPSCAKTRPFRNRP